MERSEIRALLAQTKDLLSFKQTVGEVTLPFLPGFALPLLYEPENIGEDDVVSVVHNLSRLDAGIRPTLAKALYAACQQSFEDNDADFPSPQEQLDWVAEDSPEFEGCTEPTGPDDIWPLVRFLDILIRIRGHGPHSGVPLATIRATTAWDSEHGVSFTFKNGQELVEVGDLNA